MVTGGFVFWIDWREACADSSDSESSVSPGGTTCQNENEKERMSAEVLAFLFYNKMNERRAEFTEVSNDKSPSKPRWGYYAE